MELVQGITLKRWLQKLEDLTCDHQAHYNWVAGPMAELMAVIASSQGTRSAIAANMTDPDPRQ